MIGGRAFMVSGNMSGGVADHRLMARVGPDRYQEETARPDAGELDFTGKPLKGFVYVAPAGIQSNETFEEWVDLSLEFVLALPPK
jgi:hypothetical protein